MHRILSNVKLHLVVLRRMDDRLEAVVEEIVNNKPTAGQQRSMNILDEQFVQLGIKMQKDSEA